MTLLQIAQITSAIHKEIIHHNEMADVYSKLFNEQNPEPGKYTKTQEFLQHQFNYHKMMAVVRERRMKTFEEEQDKAVTDARG